MIDRRFLLSHSAIENLRLCPQKFSLERKLPEGDAIRFHTRDTAFGATYDLGIQQLACEGKLDLAALFIAYSYRDPFSRTSKTGKTFWDAVEALEAFEQFYLPQLLESWEVFGAQTTFCIKFDETTFYRGVIDLLMQNKRTGAVVPFEVKTTKQFRIPNKYRLSLQNGGYALVADKINQSRGINQRNTQFNYVIYEAQARRHSLLELQFKMADRQRWITDMLMQDSINKMYHHEGAYAKNGAACEAYGRVCQFIDVCDHDELYPPVLVAPPAPDDFHYWFESAEIV